MEIIEDPGLLEFPELSMRVTLTCGVEGIPQPNITWYKDDIQLVGEMSNTLILDEVGLDDRGRYHCNATNFNPNEDTVKQLVDVSKDVVLNIRGMAARQATAHEVT